MNREIKFKAWDTPNKKMYLEAMPSWNGCCEVMIDTNNRNLGTTFLNPPEVGGYELLQFTGLLDKNGKEIYEGDIVLTQEYSDKPHSRTRKKKRHTGVVVYSIGESSGFFNKESNDFNRHVQYSAGWTVEIKDYGKFRCSNWGAFFDCEVIGNIYQNPDLL